MIWLLTALISPIVAFCLTRNPVALTLFGTMIPPSYIFSRITRHIFPRDDRDYKLAEVKAKYAAGRTNKKASPRTDHNEMFHHHITTPIYNSKSHR